MSARSKLAAFAVAALTIAFAAAGCTPDGEVPPDKASASAPPVRLHVAVYGPAKVVAAYRTIASDFHQANPRLTIELSAYADEEAELAAVRKEATLGHEPDLFLTGIDALSGLQRDRLIRPVDGLLGARHVDFGDGYPRYSIEQFSADNALQCMPTQYSPLVVYYNPDLVDLQRAQGNGAAITASRGWKMEQFTRAAENVVADGHAGVYVDPTIAQVGPFVTSNGGAVVDNVAEPRTTTLGSNSAASAVTQVLETTGLNKGVPTPHSSAQALKMFESGKLGMMLGYRDLTGVLRADTTAKRLNFDVLPMPRLGARSTSGDLAGVCMSSSTFDPNGSADFLAYLVGDHAMSVLARSGYVMPTNLTVTSSNSFWQPRSRPASASVFTAQVRYIAALPTTGIWPRVESLADRHLASIFAQAKAVPDQSAIKRKLTVLDEDTAAVLTPDAGAGASATASPSE
ncbi:MAG TPA: extracellular solute-binding protein [Marmoricola sp.]